MTPLDTTIPDPAAIVLIGAAGSGKSVLASTWPATQVLELDRYRALMADRAGDQTATDDAVFALHCVLEARLSRGLTSVIDATNTTAAARSALLDAAKRYSVPTVALLVPTPLDVCLERNGVRFDDRRVPEGVVREQHAAMVAATPNLPAEGFDHVVFAPNIDRLRPLLNRVSETRRRELGLDGVDGLGDELLLRRFFGPEVPRVAEWKDDSNLADGDRVVVLQAGPDSLTLAFRTDVDGAGDIGFDVLLPCPVAANNEDGEGCPGPAWAPVHNATDLFKASIGHMDDDEDLVCTRCGPRVTDTDDQDDDPEGSREYYELYAGAVRP